MCRLKCQAHGLLYGELNIAFRKWLKLKKLFQVGRGGGITNNYTYHQGLLTVEQPVPGTSLQGIVTCEKLQNSRRGHNIL